jgi:hypothetical protein
VAVVGLIEAHGADDLRDARLQRPRRGARAAVVHDQGGVWQQLRQLHVRKVPDVLAQRCALDLEERAQEDAAPAQQGAAARGRLEEAPRLAKAGAWREHQRPRAPLQKLLHSLAQRLRARGQGNVSSGQSSAGMPNQEVNMAASATRCGRG